MILSYAVRLAAEHCVGGLAELLMLSISSAIVTVNDCIGNAWLSLHWVVKCS